MKLYPLALAISAIIMSPISHAFQFEATLNKTIFENTIKTENQVNNEAESNQTILNGTFYFDDVQVNNIPRREAAFLSKISSISIGLNNNEAETNINKNPNIITRDTTDESYLINYRGVFNDFIIETTAIDSTHETTLQNLPDGSLNPSTQSTFATAKSEQYVLSFGSYIGDHQQLSIRGTTGSYNSSDIKLFNKNFRNTYQYSRTDFTGFGSSYKNVLPLPEGRHLTLQASLDILNFETPLPNEAEQTALNVNLSFYPTNQLALIVGVNSLDFKPDSNTDKNSPSNYNGSNAEEKIVSYSTGISYFPINQLQFNASINYISGENKNISQGNTTNIETNGTSITFGIGIHL